MSTHAEVSDTITNKPEIARSGMSRSVDTTQVAAHWPPGRLFRHGEPPTIAVILNEGNA